MLFFGSCVKSMTDNQDAPKATRTKVLTKNQKKKLQEEVYICSQVALQQLNLANNRIRHLSDKVTIITLVMVLIKPFPLQVQIT